MIYKKFYFENYKGIKDRLEFLIDTKTNKPYCILGNNESGKTTILKGIDFIGKLCHNHQPTNEEIDNIHKKDSWYTGDVNVGTILAFYKTDIKEEIDQELYPLLNDENELELSFFFSYEDSKCKQKTTEIKLNNNVIDLKMHAKIFDIISKCSQDILYYEDFMFSIPKVVRFKKKGANIEDKENILNSKTNQEWQKIFSDILTGSFNDKSDKLSCKTRSFQDDVIDFTMEDKQSERNIKKTRVAQMGQHLTKLLNHWIEEHKTDISEVVIEMIDNTQGFVDYTIQVLSKQKEPYKMSERSKGLQWTFCFNIYTNIRKERHSNGFIFLLDEPASNLHISLQGKMLKEMENLCKNKNLVVYSTHAPDLIDLENVDNWYFAKNEAQEMDTETNISLSKDKADVCITWPIIVKLSSDKIMIDDDNSTSFEKTIKKLLSVCPAVKNKLLKIFPKIVENVATELTTKAITGCI